MKWLSLLSSLIGGVVSFVKWLTNRQLLEAGEARQIIKNLEKEQERVKKAIDARRNVKHNADELLNDKNNRNND